MDGQKPGASGRTSEGQLESGLHSRISSTKDGCLADIQSHERIVGCLA